jgi:hypothetical protein
MLLLIASLNAECLTVSMLLLTVPHLRYRFELFTKDQMCKYQHWYTDRSQTGQDQLSTYLYHLSHRLVHIDIGCVEVCPGSVLSSVD